MYNKSIHRIGLTLGLSLLCFAPSWCQIRRSAGLQTASKPKLANVGANPKPKEKAKSHIASSIPRKLNTGVSCAKKQESNDTIYCTRTKKQHGWFMPMDTISKELASHLNLSFRFTHKYASGYWGKMETVDGYGHLTTSNMSPYILKTNSADTDKNAQEKWTEKLKTSCIYEFVADPSGKVIVQERAHDKDRNLIYTYSRVPIGNRQFIGSYKDANGLPAEMRKDPNYSYGTLVRLTEDKWGNDSVVEYIDSKGKAKPNGDGVAMEVYICDRMGHIQKQQSRNAKGELVKDNWGNCGVEYVWNDKHQNVYATYMDENWKPRKLSGQRVSTAIENGIQTAFYQFDDYGRQIGETFVAHDGTPDTNVNGIHQIKRKFDVKGNILEQSYFDLNGKLKNDATGMAVIRTWYDSQGRAVQIEIRDQDGKLRSHPGYLSTIVNQYDDDGNLVANEQYAAVNGIEHLSYQKKNNKHVTFQRWEDGVCRVDSLDNMGRTFLTVIRDSLGNLSDKDFHYAINQYKYVDLPKKTFVEERYLDKNRKLCNPDDTYAYEEMVVDTLQDGRITQYYKRYDAEGHLTDTYMHEFINGNVVGQPDMNAFGVICRAGGTSGARYYKGNVTASPSGDYSTIVGQDEFGEPDYISTSGGAYYYTKLSAKGENQWLDENNQVIVDNDDFMDQCPKVMSIEITDSAAYRLGLRDNDVVLLDGGYSSNIFALDSISQSFYDFRKVWSLHSVLDGARDRSMVVFRVNPSTLAYNLVRIDNLKGTPSELGYLVHIRYLTQKQLHRIQSCVEENIHSASPLVRKADFHPTDYAGDNFVLLAYTDLFRNVRSKPYGRCITDPSVLLGSCIKERNMKWTAEEGENTDEFERMLAYRKVKSAIYPSQDFYLTRDASTVSHLTLQNEQAVYTNWFSASVSDDCYAQLKGLVEAGKDSVSMALKCNTNDVKKQIVGCWKSKDKNSKENDFTPEVHINFMKDGMVKGILANYGTIDFDEGTALFRLQTPIEGKWSNGPKWLFNEVASSDSILTCIDVLGMDDEALRERAIAHVNSICKADAHRYLYRLNFNKGRIGTDWFIQSLSKQQMVVVSESADTIELYRTKEVPVINLSYQHTIAEGVSPDEEDESELVDIQGYWTYHDDDGSDVALDFKDDGTFDIMMKSLVSDSTDSTQVYMDLILSGVWQNHDNAVTLEVNPHNISYDFDVKSKSIGIDGKDKLLQQMKKEMKPKMEELCQALSADKFIFGKDERLTEIDSATVMLGGQILQRCGPKKEVVLGTIEGDDGYLIKQGFTGKYVVLQWCDWDCTQSIDDFAKEFERQKQNEKLIVLLPVENSNGSNIFKNVISIRCPKNPLGIRLMDLNISYYYYKKEILNRYNQHRMVHLNATD